MKNKVLFIALTLVVAGLATGCAVQRGNVERELKTVLNTDLDKAIVGVSIYHEQQQRFLAEQNEYLKMIPASVTKLLAAYAVLKYMPDSLPGWYVHETADTLYIRPNSDGTFLNPAFKEQRFYDKLAATNKPIVLNIPEGLTNFEPLGQGNGYRSARERSLMPIYGNVVRFRRTGDKLRTIPSYFERYLPVDFQVKPEEKYRVSRNRHDNYFKVIPAKTATTQYAFTMAEDEHLAYHLLQDTLKGKTIVLNTESLGLPYQPFYTHKTDAVLELMLHTSSNFLAEQFLLMVSDKVLDNQISDLLTMKKVMADNFSEFYDQPVWVEGSGLSRGNTMSPRFFISLLQKMKQEFSEDRLRKILPQGNEGTLKGYYLGNEKHIYAKTGTLVSSTVGVGVVALCGYVDTKKGNSVLFSFLVNNHQGTATSVRKSIERVITNIINHY